jgi:O-antigen/teichoic acid export membrane protein
VLFPLIVDSDASKRHGRLQQILLEGTRLSLVMVLPISIWLSALAEPLVRAWVGPQMLGAVPVLQILSVSVAIRVGNGTATTLLKGAGRHRMLAWANMIAGILNVILSIVLVQWLGLPGVAIGTLVAVAGSAIYLYPVACRRVHLPLSRAIVHSIVPPLWPAVVVWLVLVATRDISSGTLLAVLLHGALGAGLYLALFVLLAIGRKDRASYLAKVRHIAGRHSLTRWMRQSSTRRSAAA